MERTLKIAVISLVTNTAFAAYHFVFGILWSSQWLLNVGSYYLVLSLVRFVVLRTKNEERFVTRFTGWMLMILSVTLAGTVVLSLLIETGQKFHMILMIAIATYAFTKITLATINFIKSRHSTSAKLITLRNISFADAFVSIFALQRSMLVSFDGMTETEIVIMNAVLGCAVCVVVFVLGINLVINKKIIFKTLKD